MLHIIPKLKVILKLELVGINVRIDRKKSQEKQKAAVKDHCFLSGHVCSFYGFTGLHYASRKFKHLVKGIFILYQR